MRSIPSNGLSCAVKRYSREGASSRMRAGMDNRDGMSPNAMFTTSSPTRRRTPWLYNQWGNAMNQLLVDAINQKRTITIWYDGGDRVVEPHCYGEGSKGQQLLRCFQTGGYSKRGEPFAWKLMTATEIRDIRLDGPVFETPRTDYNPNDKAMRRLFARLEASAVTRPWR